MTSVWVPNRFYDTLDRFLTRSVLPCFPLSVSRTNRDYASQGMRDVELVSLVVFIASIAWTATSAYAPTVVTSVVPVCA